MTSTLPPLVQAFSGSIGSASANVITYPLDLLATLAQLDDRSNEKNRKGSGIRRAYELFVHILNRRGVIGLYDGVWTDTGATLLSSFLYYYFYSFLRSASTKHLLSPRKNGNPRRPHKPSMLEEIIIGFLAGVASRAITMPLNIVTLRLQTEEEQEVESDEDSSKSAEPVKHSSITSAARAVYREHGVLGFWRGFQTTPLTSLNPSFTLALFQLYRRLLTLLRSNAKAGRSVLTAVKDARQNAQPVVPVNPSPAQAFFGGAVSNSIATFLLYPIILAKTRLQASSARSASLKSVLFEAYTGAPRSSKRDSDKSFADAVKTELGGRPSPVAGIKGLYQGLEVQLLKGFLSQGVTLLVKGRIERMIVEAYLRRQRKGA